MRYRIFRILVALGSLAALLAVLGASRKWE